MSIQSITAEISTFGLSQVEKRQHDAILPSVSVAARRAFALNRRAKRDGNMSTAGVPRSDEAVKKNP
jgi:hypothetical protein